MGPWLKKLAQVLQWPQKRQEAVNYCYLIGHRSSDPQRQSNGDRRRLR
ncbi:hypothetical protein Halar_1272 [halophilic archaeon DL31]|jgi:hypothetical protein|nr:hypothetical protein Halar_1272 [halophilic archaeon DL31]